MLNYLLQKENLSNFFIESKSLKSLISFHKRVLQCDFNKNVLGRGFVHSSTKKWVKPILYYFHRLCVPRSPFGRKCHFSREFR